MDARENALLCYGIEGDKRLVEMATPINDLAGLWLRHRDRYLAHWSLLGWYIEPCKVKLTLQVDFKSYIVVIVYAHCLFIRLMKSSSI